MTTPLRDDSLAHLSVIIVDDERVARARLRRLLSAEPDVRIVAECENGSEAVAAILEHRPDAVFLDIEMPERSGLQVIDAVPLSIVPVFVFVTAFEEYALKAFAVEALDYLLKPFDAQRFNETMRRVRDRVGARDRQTLLTAINDLREAHARSVSIVANEAPAPDALAPHRYIERLAVKVDGNIVFVRAADIDFVEAAANYVVLHCGAELHRVRAKLSELATRLDPTRFARIHRRTIVNVDRIKEIQPWFSGDALVILRSGAKLRLSRVYRHSLARGTRIRG